MAKNLEEYARSTAVGRVFSGCPGPVVGPSARRGRGISGGVGEDARGWSKAMPSSHISSPFNRRKLQASAQMLGLVTLRYPLGKLSAWLECQGWR